MNHSLMQQDIAAAQELFTRIHNNQETFLSSLDAMLDLITFLPICADEYGAKNFEQFKIDPLLRDIASLLQDYGFQIVKNP